MSTKPKSYDVRLPPNDNDAEEAVLGALLIDGDAVHQVEGFLRFADFYYESNRIIYKACIEIASKGEAINQVTLSRKLVDTGKLETAGGSARLGYLISVCPTSLDIEHYANIVHRLSLLRQLIVAGDRISAIGYEATDDSNQALSKASDILNMIIKKSAKSNIISPAERYNLLSNRYARLNSAEQPIAVATGFIDVDKVLGGGIMPSELTILAGDSGHGKSTLAINIAKYVADNLGPVLYLTSEMDIYQYGDKEVAMITKHSPAVIRYGRYEPKIYGEIEAALGEMSERQIYFSRPIPFTMASIRQDAYRMAYDTGVKLIVVDSLNKIEINRNSNYRYAEYGYHSTDLKALSGKLEIPIITTLQLNRDLDKRMDKRPKASDIYESDQIYQDADIVLFLYRIEKYATKSEWDAYFNEIKERRARGWAGVGYEDLNGGAYPANIAEVIIDKQRVGDGNKYIKKILWSTENQCYQNLAKV